MKFSYHWLRELVPFTDTPQQLAEFLTLRVFEVETLEKKGDDWVLDIKLLPNRIADASGHIGMAREIAALKNLKLRIPDSRQIRNSKLPLKKSLKVHIENSDDCSRYTARMMTGISVGSSPTWLAKRLMTLGLQSINNIVDAANYVMLETGQPLHVFDYEKLRGQKIIVRRARAGEKIPALDDKTYALNPDILVIADAESPVAIAGIKGGKESGVSAATTTIVMESANFDGPCIRATSRALGLRTDASVRFEHGLDPNETAAALDRLVQVIQEVAGGVAYTGTADQYPRKTHQAAILFRPAYAESLLGIKIPAGFYRSAFARLGWSVKPKGKDLIVKPPTVRRDIETEQDVVEEVARLFDYSNIPPAMPAPSLAASPIQDTVYWENRIRDVLVGAGFTESDVYEFTGERELAMFRITEQPVALENPASVEMQYLVPRLMIKYVSSAAENLRNVDVVRIFGIGKSFVLKENAITERKDLILASAEKNSRGEEGFYELKGVVDSLLESLGISDHWYDDVREREATPRDKFHPHRYAEIKRGDETLGRLGEIHPAILEHIKARGRIVAAEIDVEKLVSAASAEVAYRPVGKYPAVTRDIAIVVPEDARTDDMLNIIENAGGELLVDTDLFDYFQDETLREKREKSIAFHLIFQSPDRTLTDPDVDTLMQKIVASLEAQNWEVKK